MNGNHMCWLQIKSILLLKQWKKIKKREKPPSIYHLCQLTNHSHFLPTHKCVTPVSLYYHFQFNLYLLMLCCVLLFPHYTTHIKITPSQYHTSAGVSLESWFRLQLILTWSSHCVLHTAMTQFDKLFIAFN